jgi:hypothetical protein
MLRALDPREVAVETFLVQIWVPAEPVASTDLRGVVRHISSGVETPFRGEEEVLLLLRRAHGCGEWPK